MVPRREFALPLLRTSRTILTFCLAQQHSPYFNETHAALRAEVREWVETNVEPFVTEWDEKKTVPAEIYTLSLHDALPI